MKDSLKEDEWFDSSTYSGGYVCFTARIKTSRLDEFIKSIYEGAGEDKISDYQKTATDISLNYYDKEGQIEALEAERAQLIFLMGREDTSIGDLIAINSRMADVDYKLRSLRGELNQYDSLAEYSVVELRIYKTSIAGMIVGIVFAGVHVVAGITVALIIIKRKCNKKKEANTI